VPLFSTVGVPLSTREGLSEGKKEGKPLLSALGAPESRTLGTSDGDEDRREEGLVVAGTGVVGPITEHPHSSRKSDIVAHASSSTRPSSPSCCKVKHLYSVCPTAGIIATASGFVTRRRLPSSSKPHTLQKSVSTVGARVRSAVTGEKDNASLGTLEETTEGVDDGTKLGIPLLSCVGESDTSALGTEEDSGDGIADGRDEDSMLGIPLASEGSSDDTEDGAVDVCKVGVPLSSRVGDSDGSRLGP